jgi:serine/threonine-protein kinase RsbW
MSDTIELTIGSRFEFLELVGSVTKQVSELGAFDEDSANWIELAIREAVINAIKHGNRMDATKSVEITYTLDESSLGVSIRDSGEGFDFQHLPDPLSPENLLNPNGRGIFYMKTFMDEVEFGRHPKGGTLVRLSKRRSDPEEKGD